MTIFKVSTGWAGTTGGPGLTQMYFEDIGAAAPTQAQAQNAVNAVRSFWDAVKAYVPNEVSLQVATAVDSYNHLDGALTGAIVAATPPAAVVGTGAGSYSMASGLKVNLLTANIRNGRRVRGSIYIVPTDIVAFTNAGVVSAGTRGAINTAGSGLITALAGQNTNLIVWGRPLKNDAGTVTRNGSVNYVTTIETNEKGAVLRGRRD
jgi:hypothetical protein